MMSIRRQFLTMSQRHTHPFTVRSRILARRGPTCSLGFFHIRLRIVAALHAPAPNPNQLARLNFAQTPSRSQRDVLVTGSDRNFGTSLGLLERPVGLVTNLFPRPPHLASALRSLHNLLPHVESIVSRTQRHCTRNIIDRLQAAVKLIEIMISSPATYFNDNTVENRT